MRDREEKIRVIHDAVDALLESKNVVDAIPSVVFSGNKTEENIVERVEKVLPENEPSETIETMKPIRPVFPTQKRPAPPFSSFSIEKDQDLPSFSFQGELPFLIFETPEHVEELLINPIFSKRSIDRVEEFSIKRLLGGDNIEVYETRMFGTSDTHTKVFAPPVHKPSVLPQKSENGAEPSESTENVEVPSGYTKKVEEVLEETKYFGYKGLGSRTVVFDKNTNEHRYIVKEPVLTEEEENIRKELVKLFKLLADVSTFDAEEHEKQRVLEKALNQIIQDNDIKIKESSKNLVFYPPAEGFVSSDKIDVAMENDAVDVYSNSVFEEFIDRKLREKGVDVPIPSKDKIFYYLIRDFVGYGRIDILMRDEDIEDISCDGSTVPVFVYHRRYQSIETNVTFDTPEELNSFVVRLAQICGKQISIYAPIVDGKLPDGSRLQATLAKTVTNESTFTIRRFREDPLTPIDLIENNTMSVEMAAYFWLAIEHGASILFCGGTASGKTSTLNALSLFIPFSHKIVSIEDTREVNLPHKNWIAGTTREGFSTAENEKKGKDIDMFDLIRAGLRQRPRVIIVGEVRGREAYSLFQAMATGHTSYATVHASSIHALIQRLENPPISLPRALLTSLDIIVFINAIPMGKKMVRRITSVTEIIKMDPDTKQLIFMQPFTWVSKVDDRFEGTGTSKILTSIRLTNEWDENRLKKELNNRIKVLNWMRENKVRSYTDVAKIISAYYKDSESVLKDPGVVLKKEGEEKEEKKTPEVSKHQETPVEEKKKSFFKLFKIKKPVTLKSRLPSRKEKKTKQSLLKKDKPVLKKTKEKKPVASNLDEEKEKLKNKREQKREERKRLREQRKLERQRRREQRLMERKAKKQVLTESKPEGLDKKTGIKKAKTLPKKDVEEDIDRILKHVHGKNGKDEINKV